MLHAVKKNSTDKMPFDIAEHPLLRTTWFSYEKHIKETKHENKHLNKEELRKIVTAIENERRVEMKEIQKQVRAEKKMQKELEDQQMRLKKDELSLKRELRARKKQKAQEAPRPFVVPRRSARIAMRQTKSSNSPSPI